MIGNVNQLGKGYKGVASYLESGKDGQHGDRVEWIESRNLPTRDPQTAARVMAATARDSERTAAPVYQFSISFDPGDPVDREAMRRVADRTLRDLGLQDHQTLIVAHRDTAHPHVHVVVNRVHPETARAWSNFRDFPRIERSLRAQEVEMGLRVVPGKHARVPERDGAVQAPGPAPRAGRGDAAFLADVQERAAPILQRARSWAEVEQGLAQHGLAVRVNGRGTSVTDGHQQVKASEVDRAFSRARLEQRFGPWHSHRARVAVAGLTPPGSAQRAPVAPARPRIDSDRNQLSPRPTPRTPAQQYAEAARALRADLRAIYVEPDAARRALVAAVQHRGPEAARAIRHRPARHDAGAPRRGGPQRPTVRRAGRTAGPRESGGIARDRRAHHRGGPRPARRRSRAQRRQ